MDYVKHPGMRVLVLASLVAGLLAMAGWTARILLVVHH